jgi:prepilin-type N-terminal cleavage/methylation domain-containing protein
MVFPRIQLRMPTCRGAGLSHLNGSFAAYTMIELVITMAIIAVLSAIAVPHYGRSLTRYQAEVAAKRVSADVVFARGNARIQSITQTVDFSTPANGYTLTGMTDPDHPASTYAIDLTSSPYKSTLASVTFGNGAATSNKISFDRYGAPSAGGKIVVQSGDFTKTISVDGTTGAVTVQ